jgi:L-alanine-DL-glutamate epimerase-like enolase superfamily enzyme
MAQLAARFDIVKFKIGALKPEEDLARISAILEAIPANTRLIIDCVYSYSYDQFSRIYEALPRRRIEAIQSPLPAERLRDMARLTAQGVPVMANEAEYRVELHDELIERQAVRFLQVAPVAVGGITRLRQLSIKTVGTSVDLSLEVSSTAIALTVAAQFAASSDQVTHVEHHSIHEVFFDQLTLSKLGTSNRFSLAPNINGLGILLQRTGVELAFEAEVKG